jgi:hypothetical protein
MASEVVDLTAANGVFKDRYANKVEDQIPDFTYLQKAGNAEFVRLEKDAIIGRNYRVPVTVRRPQGFTYNQDGTAFSMNDARSMRTVPAEVTGSVLALEERLSVIADSRAKTKEQAVAAVWDLVVRNMRLSSMARQEWELLYGGSSLGITPTTGTNATASAAISGSAYDGAPVHAATNVNYTTITLNSKTWSSIWSCAEGAGLNFYNGASLVGTQVFDLIAFDVATKTITVAGTAANITALAASINTPTAVDVWMEGQKGLQMTGLRTIAGNSGTLFTVNAAIWSIFKGNEFDLASAPLNVGSWTQIMATIQSRGLVSDASMLIGPFGWADFLADLTALREVDSSYKSTQIDVGHKTITMFSQNGATKVVSHPLIKDSEALIYPDGSLSRIGSTDLSFQSRQGNDNFIYELPSNFGYGLRCFWDLAIFATNPSHMARVINRVSAT